VNAKDLIERLRLDAVRLRTPAKIEQPFFRWIGGKMGYRMKNDVADDIDAAIILLEGIKP
jgi:hypothetical protein